MQVMSNNVVLVWLQKSTFSIRVAFTVSTMHHKNKCHFDTQLCHLQVPKITLLFIGTINIFWDIQ